MRLSALTAAMLLCVVTPVRAADDGYGLYLEQAREVVAALESGAEPATQADALSALAARADDLRVAFSARYPACRDYLAAAAQLGQRWPQLSLEAIESGYHHDGELPKVDDPADRALCYQMKDLLVHPLTALRMLREQPVDVDGLEHEIVEVVAHAQALQALMSSDAR